MVSPRLYLWRSIIQAHVVLKSCLANWVKRECIYVIFALAAALCDRWAMILSIKPDTVKFACMEGGWCHLR